jgi:hypothetical protein
MKFRLIDSNMRQTLWELVDNLPDSEMRHNDGTLCDGLCDGPNTKGKKIKIRQGLEDRDHMDTVIHEMLHVFDRSKDEDWVAIVAKNITNVLLKLGYKRGKTDAVPKELCGSRPLCAPDAVGVAVAPAGTAET